MGINLMIQPNDLKKINFSSMRQQGLITGNPGIGSQKSQCRWFDSAGGNHRLSYSRWVQNFISIPTGAGFFQT
jgi:hypothetical protein